MKRFDRFQDLAALPMYEEMIVTGAWWPAGYRGKTLVSLTPFGVIAYICTILFGALFTVAGLLIRCLVKSGKRPVLAWSCYAVHPMSYYGQGEVSADFPGLARRALRVAWKRMSRSSGSRSRSWR